ncbi:hypothetical protein L596_017281 [Steinernema carpocapsae]|uniref:Uncharacterized protein n=1 Tax=Steinernema carpocapsae TaxID=34508 RepID=A0A4V6A1N8_STECR|nr:hypothetical protein L596_017281 [Steinernema carpocapsae]
MTVLYVSTCTQTTCLATAYVNRGCISKITFHRTEFPNRTVHTFTENWIFGQVLGDPLLFESTTANSSAKAAKVFF